MAKPLNACSRPLPGRLIRQAAYNFRPLSVRKPAIRELKEGQGTTLAEVMDGETVQLFSRHAHVLKGRDGSALDVLSDRYRELGWRLRSAEAVADAARAQRDAGNEAQARRSAVRAALISDEFTALTPPLLDIPEGLSERELEVAWLAASGFSNQEIADRLYLSMRTVENHLSLSYRKLDVPNRTGLAEVIGD